MNMWLRSLIIPIALVVLAGLAAYQIELTLPGRPPGIGMTYTPFTKSAPTSVGSYSAFERR